MKNLSKLQLEALSLKFKFSKKLQKEFFGEEKTFLALMKDISKGLVCVNGQKLELPKLWHFIFLCFLCRGLKFLSKGSIGTVFGLIIYDFIKLLLRLLCGGGF